MKTDCMTNKSKNCDFWTLILYAVCFRGVLHTLFNHSFTVGLHKIESANVLSVGACILMVQLFNFLNQGRNSTCINVKRQSVMWFRLCRHVYAPLNLLETTLHE